MPGLPSEILEILSSLKKPRGTEYYVDPTGNGGDGKTWETAFDTLAAAVSAATEDGGDVIHVAPGNHNLTAQVEFNKTGLVVVADRPQGGLFNVYNDDWFVNAGSGLTSGAPVKVTAPTTFIGLSFGGRDLTAENLLIDSEEAGGNSGGFNYFYKCRFAAQYGAVNAGVRTKGGQWNVFDQCGFDGLFNGYGAAAIEYEVSGAVDPGFARVLGCYFSGVGSGKHAIKTEDKVLDLLVAHNYLLPGFLGNQGKMIDFDSTASTGLVADNWVAPLANQAAAFENDGSATIGYADNHYEE